MFLFWRLIVRYSKSHLWVCAVNEHIFSELKAAMSRLSHKILIHPVVILVLSSINKWHNKGHCAIYSTVPNKCATDLVYTSTESRIEWQIFPRYIRCTLTAKYFNACRHAFDLIVM